MRRATIDKLKKDLLKVFEPFQQDLRDEFLRAWRGQPVEKEDLARWRDHMLSHLPAESVDEDTVAARRTLEKVSDEILLEAIGQNMWEIGVKMGVLFRRSLLYPLGPHLSELQNQASAKPPTFAALTKARLTDLPKLWSRLVRLDELLGDQGWHHSGEKVFDYLGMAVDCYLAGLEPQSVVFLRSALETAIRERFDQDDITQPETMRQRLKFARQRRWISQVGFEDGWTVWQRGNHAVHNQPDASVDAIDTMRRLLTVLTDLAGASIGEPPTEVQ